MFIKRLIMFVLLSLSLLLFGCTNTKKTDVDDGGKEDYTRLQIDNSHLQIDNANLKGVNSKLQTHLVGLRDKNKSQITALGYLDVELSQTEDRIVGIQKKLTTESALLESKMHEFQIKIDAIASKVTQLTNLKEQFGVKRNEITVIKSYIINDLIYPDTDSVISPSYSVLLKQGKNKSEKGEYLHQKALFVKQLGIKDLNLELDLYKEKKEVK